MEVWSKDVSLTIREYVDCKCNFSQCAKLQKFVVYKPGKNSHRYNDSWSKKDKHSLNFYLVPRTNLMVLWVVVNTHGAIERYASLMVLSTYFLRPTPTLAFMSTNSSAFARRTWILSLSLSVVVSHDLNSCPFSYNNRVPFSFNIFVNIIESDIVLMFYRYNITIRYTRFYIAKDFKRGNKWYK